jgi:hypothetical protein
VHSLNNSLGYSLRNNLWDSLRVSLNQTSQNAQSVEKTNDA